MRSHPWEHHDPLLPVDPDLAPDDPGEPSPLHRPGPHLPRSRQHAALAAIAAGGFLGSLARYGVSVGWPQPSGHFPWAIFVVNTSGALVLGMLLTALLESMRPASLLRPFACVGFLGSWTTMSSLAVQADLLGKNRHLATAVIYVVATLVAGLAASWVAIATTRALLQRSPAGTQ